MFGVHGTYLRLKEFDMDRIVYKKYFYKTRYQKNYHVMKKVYIIIWQKSL